MAIAVSDEFKELWHQMRGKPERLRLRHKRRYKNGAGSYVNAADWTVLEEYEWKSIGKIPMALDVPFQNVFKIGTVSIVVPNAYGEWIEAAVPPSFFAADGTAEDGYLLYRTLIQVQHGYKLSDGTVEWVSVFTGVVLRVRITGKGATAVVDVASKAHLLEKADAEEVADTFTLEDCIPATGDGSNKAFETTTEGVDHLTDLQVNAVSLDKASEYRTENANERDSAGNTGRLAITTDAAPGNLQTVKASGKAWKKDQTIDTLLGLLFTEGDIPAGERTIDPILFPGGLSGSVAIDAQADWEDGTLIQNVSTVTVAGRILKKWLKVDDFSDGDYTASPAWTVTGPTTGSLYSIVSGAFRVRNDWGLEPQSYAQAFVQYWGAVATVVPEEPRTFRFRLSTVLPSGSARVTCWDISGNGEFSFFFDVAANKVYLDRGATHVLDLGAIPGAGFHQYRLLRDTDNVHRVYIDGVAKGTFNGAAGGVGGATRCIVNVQASGTDNCYVDIDDIYYSTEEIETAGPDTTACRFESEEFDLLSAPTAWGTLDIVEELRSGTIGYETNVAAASGGPYDGWVAIDASTKVIQSNLKRYLKIACDITPAAIDSLKGSPYVDSLTANFTVSTVNVSLAIHRGRTVMQQIERYLRIPDYELAMKGDGTAHVRAKDPDPTPVITITQGDGILDVLAYDDGIPDRVVKAGRVRHGEFVSVYDGDAAGADADTLALEAELKGKVLDEDLSDVLLSLDVNLADSRARVIYENNRRAADDPRPKRRLRLKTWIIPWLELSDVVRVAFYDNPYMRQFLAADPLHKPGPYYNWGDPANIIAKYQDFKVLSYAPDYDTHTAEMLVEEVV